MTTKPTAKPIKKVQKAFGYGEDPVKKAASKPTKTYNETLNKLDVPSSKKVK